MFEPPIPKSKNLSTTEKNDLTYHQNIVDSGIREAIKVWLSFIYIEKNNLYREDFDSFDDYSLERWGKDFDNELLSEMHRRYGDD